MPISIAWITLALRMTGPNEPPRPAGMGATRRLGLDLRHRRPRRARASSSRAPGIGRSLRKLAFPLAAGLVFGLSPRSFSDAAGNGVAEPIIRPVAVVTTDSVASQGDAADDPAIWIHPADPKKSLVLGTDKKGGLNVFDLDGRRLQVVSDGSRPNNVDLLYQFPIGGAESIDLAVAGTRTPGKFGVAFWRIDAESRKVEELGPVPSFPVLRGGEPYGLCTYRSSKTGAFYLFVTSKEGEVEQYRLEIAAGSSDSPGSKVVSGTLVRTLHVGSQVEGCVADHDLGILYLGEEDVGIWKYGAEPDAGAERTLVAKVGDHGLNADVEGLTIYYASGSKGYLIASSQGNSTYKVYERNGSNAFVLTIDPRAGDQGQGDPGETDGIDVTSAPTSPRFSKGMFVCQDGLTQNGRQNFKFFAWDEIAGDRLIVDPGRNVRGR